MILIGAGESRVECRRLGHTRTMCNTLRCCRIHSSWPQPEEETLSFNKKNAGYCIWWIIHTYNKDKVASVGHFSFVIFSNECQTRWIIYNESKCHSTLLYVLIFGNWYVNREKNNRDAIKEDKQQLLIHVDMIVGQWVYGMRNSLCFSFSLSSSIPKRDRQGEFLVCHFINIGRCAASFSYLHHHHHHQEREYRDRIDFICAGIVSTCCVLDGRIAPVRRSVTSSKTHLFDRRHDRKCRRRFACRIRSYRRTPSRFGKCNNNKSLLSLTTIHLIKQDVFVYNSIKREQNMYSSSVERRRVICRYETTTLLRVCLAPFPYIARRLCLMFQIFSLPFHGRVDSHLQTPGECAA